MTLGSFRVIDSFFPAGMLLDWHIHDAAVFAVFSHGAMQVDFSARSYECVPSVVQVHPAGERHRQRYGPDGARILVVAPLSDAETQGPLDAFLGDIHNFGSDEVLRLAGHLQTELQAPDDLTPFAAQGLTYEMLATAARRSLARDARSAPAWLERATAVVHARFRETLRLPEVAAEAGVHPAHLARVFRTHHRQSLGAYARRLRVEWAAERLRRSSDALVSIAIEAGFADQSHLTRAFRRHLGLTPQEYRRRAGRPRESGS